MIRHDDRRRAIGDPAQVLADRSAQRDQLVGHRAAFLRPRRLQGLERPPDDPGHLGPILVGRPAGRPDLFDDPRQAQELRQLDRRLAASGTGVLSSRNARSWSR